MHSRKYIDCKLILSLPKITVKVIIPIFPEEVEDISLFRLVTDSGEDVSPGERGLLLYKGGTVCNVNFSDHSANAICRLLGYSRASNWTSGYHYNLNHQLG